MTVLTAPSVQSATQTARTEAARRRRIEPRRQVVAFVGLSLGLAVIGAGAALAGVVPALLPFELAIGPLVVASVLVRREGRGSVRRLFATATRRPTDARWYLALLIPVVATAAVLPIAAVIGRSGPGLFDRVLPAALIVPVVVLLPAFAEELAWRGFALARLVTAMSPLSATVVLAIPWAALHLLLFLPGQMYEGITVWPSLLGVGSLAIITSWLYLRTGSVLITGLFHALFNGVTPLMSGLDTEVSWQLRAVVMAAIAVAILVLGGFRGIDRRTVAPTAGSLAATPD